MNIEQFGAALLMRNINAHTQADIFWLICREQRVRLSVAERERAREERTMREAFQYFFFFVFLARLVCAYANQVSKNGVPSG